MSILLAFKTGQFNMYGKLCFVALVCLAASAPSSREIKSCYADNNNPYLYTGSKTPYDYVYKGTGRITLPNCKPMQMWLLCRHGTRFPNTRTITKMLNLPYFRDLVVSNHENDKRGLLCDKDLRNLKNWKPAPGLDKKNKKYLTAQGERDLFSIGERLRTKFPELLVASASNKYKFKSTNSQRTIASMKFFIKGAFGDDFIATPEISPAANDTLLNMYEINEACEPLNETYRSGTSKEVEAFINGPEITKIIAEVSRRLGFARNISKEETFILYDACRFEKAWYLNETSPWCAAFTDDAMRVLEYKEDLLQYYQFGYGRMKINNKRGCKPARGLLDRFTKLERAKKDNKLKGVFYFTHSQTMILFFTLMNIGKDDVPITASNFRNMGHRNWRTSLLVPFATNVAAVFYSCDSSDSPFKVAFYLAENPLTLEGCENGVCDWAQLKKKLAAVVADCSKKFCEEKS